MKNKIKLRSWDIKNEERSQLDRETTQKRLSEYFYGKKRERKRMNRQTEEEMSDMERDSMTLRRFRSFVYPVSRYLIKKKKRKKKTRKNKTIKLISHQE